MRRSQPETHTERVTIAGLLANAALAIVKLIAGVVGHSYALIADAVESTTDVFASLIVWRGLRVARREPDRRHPFGYGKAESISAAAVALMLLGAAAGISTQAIREIVTPHHSPAPFTLIVLAAVVITKELLFRRVFSVGAHFGSLAVQTDAWHHRSDAITSAAAFVGIGVALLGGPAWASADDYAALIASAIIAVNGIRFLRPALLDLMDVSPGDELLEEIERVALGIHGVERIEKILARKTGMNYRVIIHVHADPDMTLAGAHALGGEVRATIRQRIHRVADVVVHMEPTGEAIASTHN